MPKTLEQTYKKFTPIEHVLARPGMYVGEIKTITSEAWVIKDGSAVQENCTWNPGIFKIFDEIITNASDETQRDKSVKNIKVENTGTSISVYNDGSGIPIEIHAEHKIYVPELIFANLLSSSNYDDTEQRTTGGLNGLGAKLTAIYSMEFTIETISKGKKYVQTFKNNLSEILKPKITKNSGKEYTKITFTPDFSRFGMKNLTDDDTHKILFKRVYDICAITPKGVSVYYNGDKLFIKDFAEYISIYIGNKKDAPRVIEETPRWSVGVSLSKTDTFQCVSFVNGISTTDHGSHVDHVINPILKRITEEIQAKHKSINIKPQYVKDSLFLFVNCLIVNPTFSSQTKDKHTSRMCDFGSRFQITDDFIKKIMKLGFVESLLAVAEAKDKKNLKKTDGKKTTRVIIQKLDDANKAGTKESGKCTIILTEGDSAKTTAISGLSVVGRDYYGVFPLRGKLLNTRTASFSQISANKEINDLKQIIGLQVGKEYSDVSELRYGKILIMTDQDTDGFHIKSLIVNFIGNSWPSLLKHDFIHSLLTPIVKVSKKQELLQFYNLNDYEDWKKALDSSKWNIKYYKGLGTSTPAEAKEYFRNMKKFTYKSKKDADLKSLELAFDKTQADARKQWITSTLRNTQAIDYLKKEVSISELVNKELVLFSIQDNIRSIPSLVDGLKPSQRKVLFSCFKRNLRKEIKVAQLAGYVSEHTSYHHGEQSLMDAIINMAQDYMGGNNANLLVPSGQFGTRLMGGKDASSPRYIFTRLSTDADKLFNPDDFELLEYLNDDGNSIEPKYYVPTMPLILINGSTGIGTGFSTHIPCFNPKDIKDRLLKLVDDPDCEIEELTPWYRGFTGTIKNVDENKWVSIGNYAINDYTVTITELPVGIWTEDYKAHLDKLEIEDTIHNYVNNSTEDSVNFVVKVRRDILKIWKQSCTIEKNLKLTSNINAQNMHMFDEKGEIVKMYCPEEILYNFWTIRTNFHKKRKESLLKKLGHEMKILESRVRFIESIIKEELIVFRRKKVDIVSQLKKDSYYPYNDFSYLVDMPISTFSEEKILSLKESYNIKHSEHSKVDLMTIKDFWISDLKN